MFQLRVETTFAAAHALMIGGRREPNHGHNWHVTVSLAGDRLDADGLLIDFHEVEGLLAEVTGPFRNADLNRTAPFDSLNPSAENVAKYIAEAMDRKIRETAGGRGVRAVSARVTEAPGCSVTYEIPTTPGPREGASRS